MTPSFIEKLFSERNCPVCGAAGISLVIYKQTAKADYRCGAIFAADETGISVATTCPAGSQLACEHLMAEAEAEQPPESTEE